MGSPVGNGLIAMVVTFVIGIFVIAAVASAKKKQIISEAVETNRSGEHARIASIDKSNPYMNIVNFDLNNGLRVTTTVPTDKVLNMVVGDTGSLVYVDNVFVSFTRDSNFSA